jgi:hypothetical protein
LPHPGPPVWPDGVVGVVADVVAVADADAEFAAFTAGLAGTGADGVGVFGAAPATAVPAADALAEPLGTGLGTLGAASGTELGQPGVVPPLPQPGP